MNRLHPAAAPWATPVRQVPSLTVCASQVSFKPNEVALKSLRPLAKLPPDFNFPACRSGRPGPPITGPLTIISPIICVYNHHISASLNTVKNSTLSLLCICSILAHILLGYNGQKLKVAASDERHSVKAISKVARFPREGTLLLGDDQKDCRANYIVTKL